jgi:hypothetical protein
MTCHDLHDFPWPQDGDDPFALPPRPAAEHLRLVASLNFTHDEPWGGMAEGFKRLGDAGVASVEAIGHGQDYLVYPIAFNYRHYIELALKEIIRDARRFLDEAIELPRTHNLTSLWNTAESLLRQIEPGSEQTNRQVRECLDRFSGLDPSGEAFRYPIRADGDPALPPELRSLDLGQMRDVVARLASFFEGTSMQLSVHLDYKSDFYRDYADW